MEDQSKENQIRAKQAISPAGLGDQSVEGNSGPGSEPETVPDLVPNELADKYLAGDEPSGDLHQTHPNRNRDGKGDIDKPAYS